ncbi:hypothetical protein L1987_11512 [Smallanthus sonchifolius]|uniref:Uncharacterized protein n=1 Tax=Smallanthus sonchifolius TaxID=185202 RepID=A0ACB9JC15_9ASTR|nr:hypothetical protein L1987_11512 [Smallanthus sonchifolius]
MAVLLAATALTAMVIVLGGHNDDRNGMAVKHRASFKFFLVFSAIAFYTFLAVVVVHMTGMRGETKAERKKLVEFTNKSLWLASVCISVVLFYMSEA